MYCPKCGADIGTAKFCPECGTQIKDAKREAIDEVASQFSTDAPVARRRKKPILKRWYFWVIVIFVVLIASLLSKEMDELDTITPAPNIFAEVDEAQATSEHCKEVAEYVTDYLQSEGYQLSRHGAEWIGYYKYVGIYSMADYEELQLGGYYSYTAELPTGEMITGRVQTYWAEGETPVIINLTLEEESGDTPIIEYDEAKIAECWDIYYSKATDKT